MTISEILEVKVSVETGKKESLKIAVKVPSLQC